MDIIPVKKSKVVKDGAEVEVFIVPAIAMQKPDGSVKKIPHPNGYDNLVFKKIESAIEVIDRAGFGYSLDDKQVPPGDIYSSVSPDLSVSIRPLLEMLEDTNSSAVAAAAYALGELRACEAIDPLIELIGFDDTAIRMNSTDALAKIGDPAVKGLILALDDTNWVKRNSAAIALGALVKNSTGKVLRAINPLTQRLKDSNPVVRASAANAIGKIAEIIYKHNS